MAEVAEKHRKTHLLVCLLACLLARRYSSIKLALVVVVFLVCWFVAASVRWCVGVLVSWCSVCWNWLNW